MPIDLFAPRLAELIDHPMQWPGGRVAGGVPRGQLGGVRGSEVGPLAGESHDPLLARLVGVGGDQVDSIVLAAASHRHVGGGGGAVLVEGEVRGDCSRFAYSEILANERKETAAGFWERARAAFAAEGITVEAVMTDNGACYRSTIFAAALGRTTKHLRTRPYRPQTNGKVERFNRTLAAEWAYTAVYLSEQARAATYLDWLHFYNHHRPHTGLGGLVPAARAHNLTGNYS